ncbi:MAG: hypothetical protein IT305_14210 [Chloroflexi bacterium]|nr:hypothetical protein [Chloroflexota bacterium]
MDLALLFSSFLGLLAAFMACALWATRPAPSLRERISRSTPAARRDAHT